MEKPVAEDLFLEQDKDPATVAFVEARNDASASVLTTPHMEETAKAIQALMEREDRLIIPSRRGNWYFDFHRTATNPLGLWRRLPADLAPSPDAPWETVFDVDAFCERIADAMVAESPRHYIAEASKAKREGLIFIDWLRNTRGATSVTGWSLRARPGAPVAMPVGWGEIARLKSGAAFDLTKALKRAKSLEADPWAGIAELKQSLPS